MLRIVCCRDRYRGRWVVDGEREEGGEGAGIPLVFHMCIGFACLAIFVSQSANHI